MGTRLKLSFAVKIVALSLIALFAVLIAYAGLGYIDAIQDSAKLKQRADALAAAKEGPDDLTPRKLEELLRVDDPTFWRHSGVDFQTKGSGFTSITQSLAKRLAFSHFEPGIRKVRQTTYAVGLERRLSKKQILTLFLATAELGRGPHGWMTGVFDASREIYGKPPADLSDHQWLRLVAVLVAPKQFNLVTIDRRLDERVERIERLIAGQCEPQGKRDIWLKGCA